MISSTTVLFGLLIFTQVAMMGDVFAQEKDYPIVKTKGIIMYWGSEYRLFAEPSIAATFEGVSRYDGYKFATGVTGLGIQGESLTPEHHGYFASIDLKATDKYGVFDVIDVEKIDSMIPARDISPDQHVETTISEITENPEQYYNSIITMDGAITSKDEIYFIEPSCGVPYLTQNLDFRQDYFSTMEITSEQKTIGVRFENKADVLPESLENHKVTIQGVFVPDVAITGNCTFDIARSGYIMLTGVDKISIDGIPADEISSDVLHHPSPREQLLAGASQTDVFCNPGLEIIFKKNTEMPVCVSETTAKELVHKRGWGSFEHSIYTKTVTEFANEQCNLIPDTGKCRAAFPAYYFDQKTNSCEEFIWGGCGGIVPFETLAACQQQC